MEIYLPIVQIHIDRITILFISFAPTIPLLMLLVMVDNAADLRRRLAG